jgi:hypothetical protein
MGPVKGVWQVQTAEELDGSKGVVQWNGREMVSLCHTSSAMLLCLVLLSEPGADRLGISQSRGK